MLAASCGESKPAPSAVVAEGQVPPTLLPTDGPADAGQGDSAAAPADVVAPSFPRTGLPLPDGVTPPRRLLPPTAELTGGPSGSSCSHQQPASGDGHRWCAFSAPGAAGADTELWVVDITAAAAGDIPLCDGSSAACLRLTTHLWTEFPLIGPGHPYAQAFDGDTLIFYADATSGSDQPHRGPVYAWRPGWPAARQLTSEAGFACRGHETAAVAVCMDDVVGEVVAPSTFTLRAGPLGGADNAGPLPVVGPIAPVGHGMFADWQSAFSRAGDRLIVSSPDPDSGLQILRELPLDAVGAVAPTPIVTDAHSWVVSNDGRRVYFYRQTPGAAEGDPQELYAADFPSGANVTKLASGVHDYFLLGDGDRDEGLVYMTETDPAQGASAFVYLADTAAPATTQTWFSYQGSLEDVLVSGDRRLAMWLSDGFVATAVHSDTLNTCVLNTGPRAAFVLEMLENAGLAFWTEDATDGFYGRDAYVTQPDSCDPKQRFARGMYWYTPVGDRGLVFGDELGSFDRVVAMKYAGARNAAGAWTLQDPVRIDDGADPEFVVIDTASPLLLYIKHHADAANGTYLFGPIPFSAR